MMIRAEALVVGGGPVGSLLAASLATRGVDVALLERDQRLIDGPLELEWERASRRGVPQYRHVHSFGCAAVDAIQKLAPDVIEQLRASGARLGDVRSGPESPMIGHVLRCRRPLLDLALYRHAIAVGVRAYDGVSVISTYEDRSGQSTRTSTGVVESGIVFDCSGRNSRLARNGRIRENIGLAYVTAWYRTPRPDDLPILGVRALLNGRIAVLTPADGGWFTIAVIALEEDREALSWEDRRGFETFVSSFPGIAARLAELDAAPFGPVRFAGKLYRSRVSDLGSRQRVLQVGDAALTTNPTFARGLNLGLANVAVIADAKFNVTDPMNANDLIGPEYARRTKEWLEDTRAEDAALRASLSSEKTDNAELGNRRAIRRRWFDEDKERFLASDEHARTLYLMNLHGLGDPGEWDAYLAQHERTGAVK